MLIKKSLKKSINNYILILLIILSSCSKVNNNLKGNWAIYKMHYKGKDISKIVDSSSIYITNSMIIDNNKILFVINTRPKTIISSSYKYFSDEETEFIEILNSDDKRFEGKYTLEIENPNGQQNPQEYSIKLKSNNMYIEGLKYVTSLP
jgi:hypothetical protein